MRKHKNAILAAFFFCNFEGTIWLCSKDFYEGSSLRIIPLLVAIGCMAAFITYTGKVSHNGRS